MTPKLIIVPPRKESKTAPPAAPAAPAAPAPRPADAAAGYGAAVTAVEQ